ncbi:hypothetical protein CKM354_001221400 [Cercospora kikuchii]|uniref:Uncharacterized protein n=1 Tax=Cercospora kikuchii TaxID=84275 RepID=A0A9P3L165_9PEZI|nr:uncharacterized protein CKM354_001221400 [Cercospora kikuchii]GIZ49179.1 hypothetical protein CKM354_001221400 [Cercospora kikuchii]
MTKIAHRSYPGKTYEEMLHEKRNKQVHKPIRKCNAGDSYAERERRNRREHKAALRRGDKKAISLEKTSYGRGDHEGKDLKTWIAKWEKAFPESKYPDKAFRVTDAERRKTAERIEKLEKKKGQQERQKKREKAAEEKREKAAKEQERPVKRAPNKVTKPKVKKQPYKEPTSPKGATRGRILRSDKNPESLLPGLP